MRGSAGAAVVLVACAASLAVLLAARVLGPADLYGKDQPKTLAYTADVVRHGRVALPRDALGRPATKPPLFNWLAAAGVAVVEPFSPRLAWSETVMKWPSLAGMAAVVAVAFVAGRRTTPGADGLTVGAVAAVACVANAPTLRMLYVARPDVLLAACLAGAWWLGTMGLRSAAKPQAAAAKPRAAWVAAGFWACVLAAALAKGPAALLPVIYVAVASRPIGGRGSAVRRLYPAVGLTVVIVGVGAWLSFAARQDAGHVWHTMLGRELVGRAASADPEGNPSHPFWIVPAWFGGKFLPWSGLTLIACGVFAWRLRHGAGVPPASAASRRGRDARATTVRRLAPAVFWLGVNLAFFSLSAGKRIDYLIPAFLPGAVLAGWAAVWLGRRLRLGRFALVPAAVGTLAVAAYYAHWQMTRSPTVDPWSDRAAAFARAVRPVVGDDSMVMLVRGQDPLLALLGRHPGDGPTPADLQAARWAILPRADGGASVPTVVSRKLPIGFGTMQERAFAPLALYDLSDDGAPTPARLGAIASDVRAWNGRNDPYSEP